jgi:hypothetical protein
MAINHISDLTGFNKTLSELQNYGGAYPGQVFPFQGNLYQVVLNRQGAALTVGQAVSLNVGAAGQTGNLTAASTAAVIVTDDTLDANLKGNRSWPGLVFVTATALATTEDMEKREVKGNSTAAGASTITVAELERERGPNDDASDATGAFSTTPDANYDFAVFVPFEVVLADLDALTTSIVQGIVVSTSITDNQYGIIQVAGIAMAEVDGTTDLVAGDILIVTTTGGVLGKRAVTDGNATTIGTEISSSAYVVGRILNAYTADAAGRRAIQLLNTPLIPYPIGL